MKNKILGIMALLAICLISITAVHAGSTVGEITEGQIKIFQVDAVEYEIELLVISETSNEVKFRINGEITDVMKIGDVEIIADGSKLELRDITGSKAVFYLGRPGPNYDCRGQIGVLKDGEEYAFRISQMQYVIKAEKIQGNFKLKVNGEYTNWMYIGTEQVMADGLQIKILDMGSDDVTFCLTAGPAPTTPYTTPQRIDLRYYPDLFIQDNKLNAVLVVGDQAPADDVIAAVDTTVSFQNRGVRETGTTALASEIRDYNRNIISMGRPCDNAVTAQILRSNGISEYDSDCSYGLRPGQAMVYLFDYNGYAHMLVFGYSRMETRQAARALTFQKMSGRKMLLEFNEDAMPQPEPTPPSKEEWYCKDSDGMNEFVKGEAYGPTQFVSKKGYEGEPVYRTDYCSTDRPEEQCQDQNCLVEYYCKSDKEMGYKVIHCENGCRNGACIKGNNEESEPPVTEAEDKECLGCRKNGACLQVGIRLLENDKPVYCDYDNAFKPQKQNNQACMNNYECLSNTCQDGTCQSMSEKIESIREELKEQKGILQRIYGFFERIFG